MRKLKIYKDIIYKLSILLNSNIRLNDSLKILAEKEQNKKIKPELMLIIENLEMGKKFSYCLENLSYLNIPKIYISFIKVGEESGNLSVIIDKLYEYINFKYNLLKKLKSLLIYPIILIILIIFLIIFLSEIILPMYITFYKEYNHEVPKSIIIFIHIYKFLKRNIWVIFLLGLFFKKIINKKYNVKLEYKLLKLKYNIPIFGNIYLLNIQLNFFFLLKILLESNISLLKSLKILFDSINNIMIKNDLKEIIIYIEDGNNFEKSIDKLEFINNFNKDLLRVSYITGDLVSVLETIINNIRSELSYKIKVSTELIEPLMIFLVGMIITFLVVNIIIPMFEITSMI